MLLLAASTACTESVGPVVSTASPMETLWTVADVRGQDPPAVDDSAVYVLTIANLERVLVAVDRRTRSVRWGATVPWGGGFVTQLGAVPGTIVVAAGAVQVIDANTGTERWRIESYSGRGDRGYALTPSLLVPSQDGAQHGVPALDLLTGGERWRAPLQPITGMPEGVTTMRTVAPTLHGSSLLVPFNAQSVSGAWRPGLARLDAATGALLWSTTLPGVESGGGIPFGRPVAVGGDLVVVPIRTGSRLVALDLATGSHRWTVGFAPPPPGAIIPPSQDDDVRPVAVVDAMVVAASQSGAVTGYDARTGALRWNVHTWHSSPQAMHVLPKQRILISGFGRLTIFEPRTGAWINPIPLGNFQYIHGVDVRGDTVFANRFSQGLTVFRLP